MTTNEKVIDPTWVDVWKSKPVLGVVEAGELLGLGRSAAYDAVRRGDIPSIRIGRRLLVPTVPLLASLGVAVVSVAGAGESDRADHTVSPEDPEPGPTNQDTTNEFGRKSPHPPRLPWLVKP